MHVPLAKKDRQGGRVETTHKLTISDYSDHSDHYAVVGIRDLEFVSPFGEQNAQEIIFYPEFQFSNAPAAIFLSINYQITRTV